MKQVSLSQRGRAWLEEATQIAECERRRGFTQEHELLYYVYPEKRRDGEYPILWHPTPFSAIVWKLRRALPGAEGVPNTELTEDLRVGFYDLFLWNAEHYQVLEASPATIGSAVIFLVSVVIFPDGSLG